MNDIVSGELAVGGEVAVYSSSSLARLFGGRWRILCEDGHLEARETIDVHLVWSETRSSTNCVVVGELDVKQVEVQSS